MVDSPPVSDSLTDQAARRKKLPVGCLIPFFGIFLLVGLGAVWFLSIRPILLVVDARGWHEVPCEILSSEVGHHRGSKGGTTYSIDIRYRYEWLGSTRESEEYDFFGGSSSGYDGKAEVVARYPAGSTRTCFVNPRDPGQAVLERSFQAIYLLGLTFLLFVAVPVVGIYFVLRRPRPRKAGDPPKGMTKVYRKETPGAATLRPSTTPGCRLGIAIAFCLFWNGIVSVFLFSGLDGCMAVFMIPFVLVGLGLLGWVGYQFLSLFNPVPVLTVSREAAPLGGSFDLDWRFDGSVKRLKNLKITLEGREEATYRRGTKTSTDKSVFTTLLLHGDAVVGSGRVNVVIPRGTMHSFAARNNKIVWVLRVQGEIARWPDVGEEFPFTVLPAEGLA